MNNQLPITALAALIVLGMHVGEATKKSLDDGKFDITDVPNFLPVIPYVGKAFENIKDVPAQFKDIDANEADELKKLIIESIGEVLDQEKLVSQIDASLEWIHATYKLVNVLKA